MMMTLFDDEQILKAYTKDISKETAIKLIRNSAKVANFCADVIGDMDNILSNTALKSGFAYEKPHSKKQSSAYWKVADYVKKFNS